MMSGIGRSSWRADKACVGKVAATAPLRCGGRWSQRTAAALFQGSHLLAAQSQAHDLVQELGRFLHAEAQIGGADLNQLAAGAQAGQGQGWVGAVQQDQVQVWRQVIQQEGQGGMDDRIIDQVEIVQRQDGFLFEAAETVDEQGQNRFPVRRLGGLQQRSDFLFQARFQGLQRGGKAL